jgi:hypothetical protein
LPEVCTPSYTSQVTTLRSDWDDLNGAVNYVRALISGELDQTVPQQVVRDLYADLRTDPKAFIDIPYPALHGYLTKRGTLVYNGRIDGPKAASSALVHAKDVFYPRWIDQFATMMGAG